MLLSLYMFDSTFLRIVTITFSALIVIELLNVYSEVNIIINFHLKKIHKLHILMLASTFGSGIVYFLSIMLMKNVISVDAIDTQFVIKVLIVSLFSWAPLHIIKKVMSYLNPTESEKMRKSF